MKKILRKNQIIVTLLAVLIAIAGYLNYTGKIDGDKSSRAVNNTYDSVYSDEKNETGDIASLDYESETAQEKESEKNMETQTAEPGEAVFTNGTSFSSYAVQARLDREQVRSKNKETLLEVINSDTATEKEKKKAVKSMVKIADSAETENTIESLLKAKGFSDVVITISDKQADVIVSEDEVSDEKRAQIEDVIKRKTGFSADAITITPAAASEKS